MAVNPVPSVVLARIRSSGLALRCGNRRFWLDSVGELSASPVRDRDDRGYLLWADEAAHKWFLENGGSPPSPTPNQKPSAGIAGPTVGAVPGSPDVTPATLSPGFDWTLGATRMGFLDWLFGASQIGWLKTGLLSGVFGIPLFAAMYSIDQVPGNSHYLFIALGYPFLALLRLAYWSIRKKQLTALLLSRDPRAFDEIDGIQKWRPSLWLEFKEAFDRVASRTTPATRAAE